MKITRNDLRWAAAKGILQPGQDEELWDALSARPESGARFDIAHVSYYAGALLVMGAMGWFMTKAWETLPGLALTAVADLYAVVFVFVSHWLLHGLRLRAPSGLLLTMAVAMTPLALYGLMRQFGLWPQGDPGAFRDFHYWIRGSWITLELGTIVAGAIALRFRRFAFLTAPIAVALWYLSMDLTPLMFGASEVGWQQREWVSLWFGLVILVVAYAIDRRGDNEDFAFWIYLFGLLAFWGGLSFMDSNSELRKFVYGLINVGLIGTALLLRRVMFVVFGACGCLGYLGHLAYRIFDNSLIFSLALTIIGLALIALGIIYQRNHKQIESMLQAKLPKRLRALIPARARS